MRKIITSLLAATLLLSMLALPAQAAEPSLRYILETDVQDVCAGERFTVTVSVEGMGYAPSYLRFYLLYDRARFAPDLTALRHGIAAQGMYALRDATGEAAKYPAGIAPADYGVLVLQWCSLPQGGSLPRLPANEATAVFTLTFEALGAMVYPGPGGNILLSGDYAAADSPWLDATPVELSQAALSIAPAPLVELAVQPGQSVVLGEGYVYGFDPAMTQQGSVSAWRDSLLPELFAVTNGSLRMEHSGKAENARLTGTGSALVADNLTGTRSKRYTVLVFGDLDGNFLVDLDDYAKAKTLTLGPVGDDLQRLAADTAAPFGELTAADVTAIYNAAIGKGLIDQSGAGQFS